MLCVLQLRPQHDTFHACVKLNLQGCVCQCTLNFTARTSFAQKAVTIRHPAQHMQCIHNYLLLNTAVHAFGHLLPSVCGVLQKILQYTQAQLHSLFKARQSYLTILASISRHRHCLALKLQSSPAALGANFEEVVASQLTVNNISKQLQDLQSEGHSAYMLYMKRVAFEVSFAYAVHAFRPLPFVPFRPLPFVPFRPLPFVLFQHITCWPTGRSCNNAQCHVYICMYVLPPAGA